MNRDLDYVLNYMVKYTKDRFMQDSEPMLNHRDIELVLKHIYEIEEENKQLKEEKPYLYTNTEWEDILEYQGKSYIEFDRFKTIQEENKQLKQDLKDACYVIEKIKKEKQQAIEYINKRMVHEGEYWIRKAYHFRNTEYGKDLLLILGDKE